MQGLAVAQGEVEVAVAKYRLQRNLRAVRKELDASPCIYRGCDMFADCETCKGWKDGCTARRPEALDRDLSGEWEDTDP